MLTLEKTSQNLYIHLRRSSGYPSFFFKAVLLALLFHTVFRLLFVIETPLPAEEIIIEPTLVSAYLTPSVEKSLSPYPSSDLALPLYPILNFEPSLLEPLFVTIDQIDTEVLIGSKSYTHFLNMEDFQ